MYNRYADRSYTQSTQMAREKMAKKKLSVLRHSVERSKIVLCDDSIVRGTQIMEKVRELKKAGAKAVHVRVACPPIIAPCFYGIDMSTLDELFAPEHIPPRYNGIPKLELLEKMAEDLGVNSLRYLPVPDLGPCIGGDRSSLCLGCVTGKSRCVQVIFLLFLA